LIVHSASACAHRTAGSATIAEQASGAALSAAGFLLNATFMATLGGMRFPRLVDHPQAAAKLRDGMVEAIDVLAMDERAHRAPQARRLAVDPKGLRDVVDVDHRA
jgi:hypothetical protein